jgi:hypothetical protein
MKTGSSLLLILVVLAAPVASAAKKKLAGDSYARIAVTVFRDPGFALPGADVTLIPAAEDSEPKVKKMKGVSDSRGEYVFRVPVEAMRYTVQASAKGFATQRKAVSIEGETTIDVTFTLTPESKK